MNAFFKDRLEALYERLNRLEYVHPDPLEFLYRYDDPTDREIVGMVASALAYGRVAGILKSVSAVLKIMGARPALFLRETSPAGIREALDGFVHRFADADKTASFLVGIKGVLAQSGALGECFALGMKGATGTREPILPGLRHLAGRIRDNCPSPPGHLAPDPRLSSACKRYHLFLRWMVRKDAVDPGGWDPRWRSRLIVPLDAHMHRIGLALGFTERKSADLKTALEITGEFAKLAPEDPVRYDFCLTRLGIRDDEDLEAFLNSSVGER